MKVIAIAQEHRAAWDRLYQGYAEFYHVEQTPEMRDRVWSWIHDPDHGTKGFIALDENGAPIGLTHYRPFARPLMASEGGFLDDLFVDPASRGSGAAQALIDAVVAEGRKRGWTVIRWITAEDNYRARSAYDRLAVKTKWTTYDIKL
jgi:GNAT superfamily N-acetyltransferase